MQRAYQPEMQLLSLPSVLSKRGLESAHTYKLRAFALLLNKTEGNLSAATDMPSSYPEMLSDNFNLASNICAFCLSLNSGN